MAMLLPRKLPLKLEAALGRFVISFNVTVKTLASTYFAPKPPAHAAIDVVTSRSIKLLQKLSQRLHS